MNFPTCYFCPSADLTFPEQSGVNYIEYKCDRCTTNFYYDPKHPNVLAVWQFTIEYKKQRFWVTWENFNNCTEIDAAPIESCQNQRTGISSIIKLSGQTFITPFNILQKLPIILTFL
jgi:hypothetical protein